MGDPYNPYGSHYYPHHQVKANIAANGVSQEYSYSLPAYDKTASHHGTLPIGPESAGDVPPSSSLNALSSLNDCVNKLQTSLNQYLTKIIDEGSDGPSNYNLGSGEVLNSQVLEQYSNPGEIRDTRPSATAAPSAHSTGPNTASAFASPDMAAMPGQAAPPGPNGYSYYSNYPQSYPAPPSAYGQHHIPPMGAHQAGAWGQHPHYGMGHSEDFQEPHAKKQKSQ